MANKLNPPLLSVNDHNTYNIMYQLMGQHLLLNAVKFEISCISGGHSPLAVAFSTLHNNTAE